MGEHVLIGLKHDSTKSIQEEGTAGSLDLPGGPSAWTSNELETWMFLEDEDEKSGICVGR